METITQQVSTSEARSVLWDAVTVLEKRGMHKAAEVVRHLIPPVECAAYKPPKCGGCAGDMVWTVVGRTTAEPGYRMWVCPACDKHESE